MARLFPSRRLRRTGFSDGVEAALFRVAKKGPVQQIRAISISGGRVQPCDRFWPITAGSGSAGCASSAALSPDLGSKVAIGMVRMTYRDEGAQATVTIPDGPRPATNHETFLN